MKTLQSTSRIFWMKFRMMLNTDEHLNANANFIWNVLGRKVSGVWFGFWLATFHSMTELPSLVCSESFILTQRAHIQCKNYWKNVFLLLIFDIFAASDASQTLCRSTQSHHLFGCTFFNFIFSASYYYGSEWMNGSDKLNGLANMHAFVFQWQSFFCSYLIFSWIFVRLNISN